MGQHCIAENPMQYCPRGPTQHCIKKIQFNIVLIFLGQHCTCQNPMPFCLSGSRQHCIRNDPVNVVLILLGQHCTVRNPMQCCSRGSRQHCIKKDPVQFCPNTLGTILPRWKPYAMLSKRLQTTLYEKKSCAMFC